MDLGEMGRRLFNNPTRLLTAAWILMRDPVQGDFFQKEIADGVENLSNDPESPKTAKEVVKALKLLIDFGMVVQQPRTRGSNRVYYEGQLEHPGWDIIRACLAAAPHID
jgi:hypothetical protein